MGDTDAPGGCECGPRKLAARAKSSIPDVGCRSKCKLGRHGGTERRSTAIQGQVPVEGDRESGRGGGSDRRVEKTPSDPGIAVLLLSHSPCLPRLHLNLNRSSPCRPG